MSLQVLWLLQSLIIIFHIFSKIFTDGLFIAPQNYPKVCFHYVDQRVATFFAIYRYTSIFHFLAPDATDHIQFQDFPLRIFNAHMNFPNGKVWFFNYQDLQCTSLSRHLTEDG